MLFDATMVSTVYPPPASSKLLQFDTMLGIWGMGLEVSASTVPSGSWTGGVNVYQGVLMHTGT